MSKIHLVLIDKETDYLEAITDYILNNESNRFIVSSFSKTVYLNEFLAQTDREIDVLLIDERMYDESLVTEEFGIVLLLSGIKTYEKHENLHVIYKYQSGNEITKAIIKVLSQEQDKDVYLQSYDGETKWVAVYSPSGGVGKTTTALVSSILCSDAGDKTLYLNLEPFQSTPLFFDCKEEENFSEAFYHIKNMSKNLSLKIEGIISVDPLSKVHYFSPPESVIDINEFSEDDVNTFIKEINLLNKYDYVFIDMHSNLDRKNISILSKSDQILLIITPDALSILKTKSFLKDLEILSKRFGDNLIDKVSIIINKYNPDIPFDIGDFSLYNMQIQLKIPRVPRIFISQEHLFRIDMESEFTISLREYVNHFLRR